MVAEDFNAKSSAWGSGTTDAGGRSLWETIHSLQVEVVNKKSVITFHKDDRRESVLDVTLVSQALIQKMQW